MRKEAALRLIDLDGSEEEPALWLEDNVCATCLAPTKSHQLYCCQQCKEDDANYAYGAADASTSAADSASSRASSEALSKSFRYAWSPSNKLGRSYHTPLTAPALNALRYYVPRPFSTSKANSVCSSSSSSSSLSLSSDEHSSFRSSIDAGDDTSALYSPRQTRSPFKDASTSPKTTLEYARRPSTTSFSSSVLPSSSSYINPLNANTNSLKERGRHRRSVESMNAWKDASGPEEKDEHDAILSPSQPSEQQLGLVDEEEDDRSGAKRRSAYGEAHSPPRGRSRSRGRLSTSHRSPSPFKARSRRALSTTRL
jgi:hypothetical protein